MPKNLLPEFTNEYYYPISSKLLKNIRAAADVLGLGDNKLSPSIYNSAKLFIRIKEYLMVIDINEYKRAYYLTLIDESAGNVRLMNHKQITGLFMDKSGLEVTYV